MCVVAISSLFVPLVLAQVHYRCALVVVVVFHFGALILITFVSHASIHEL